MQSFYTCLLFSSLIFLTTVQLFAQPTLTTNILPTIGDSYDVRYSTTDNFDPGPAGADVVWNFSGLSHELSINYNILAPAASPGHESFPDADFVWNLAEFEQYSFYQIDGNTVSLVGGVSGTADDITFMTVYNDLEDGLQLPITYGTEYTYNSSFDNYIFGNLLSSGTRTGTVTADAYGTIITPLGTWENVLRVKIEAVSDGITSTQYAWWNTDDFIPVLQYEFSSDSDEEEYFVYTKNNSPSTNITESPFHKTNFTIFSNTSELIINIDAPESLEDIQFLITATNGKSILMHNVPGPIENKQSITIPLKNELVSGVYILALKSTTGISSRIFYHQG